MECIGIDSDTFTLFEPRSYIRRGSNSVGKLPLNHTGVGPSRKYVCRVSDVTEQTVRFGIARLFDLYH